MQYGAFHYGRHTPARIATSSVLLTETALPGELMYQPIVPFLPPVASGSGSGGAVSSESSDTQVWSRFPTRCDLTWYQGDDVTIPLYFDNPGDTDMSDQDGWEWNAEVRVMHSYRSELVNMFSVDSVFLPADPDLGQDADLTKVTLFLPRWENIYVGQYRWDLHSVSPIEGDMSEFPRPPDDPDPWPPTTTLRTWLYGVVTILPRVTETDSLPVPITGGGTTPMLPTGAVFVGPNGRVP